MKSPIPTADLSQAIWNCDLPALQCLVEAGADLEKTAGRWAMFAYSTPLGAAVSQASSVIAKHHIEANQAAVEAGWTKPIDHAKERSIVVEMVKLLLRAGANPDKLSPTRSPLHLAVGYEDLETVRILLQSGASPEGIAVSTASKLSRREGRKFIEGFYGTSLHCAAEQNLLEIAKALIAAGANPERLDYEDQTPLQVASARGHKEVADFLASLPASAISTAK